MARRERVHEEDDGRTIADMSDLARPGMFGFRKPQKPSAAPAAAPEQPSADEPWREAEPLMTPEERRWYVLGALKAALLIGMAFVVGIGLVVLLFVAGAKLH